MRPDQREKIDTLLLREISGNLSSADTAVLQQYASEDQEVRSLWHTLRARINSAEGQQFKQSLNADADWPLVSQRIQENKRRTRERKLRFGLLLTSLIAIIVYACTLYIRQLTFHPSVTKQSGTGKDGKPAKVHYYDKGK
ncbi:hypothetical protein MKQ68_01815 [Chitinophaga horti]|uniref:Uncharacterized protein n=1 Tax=Chitinophaga horti TaxID=2920382 RepID=A0ABY6J2E5_9BACT|nr:hypothetical protein [Chitinophaga horti]UYQ93830.1 hypothetical protein MKQ68_01815 [Chitinophaga horti]